VEYVHLSGLAALVAGPVLILRLRFGARWSSFLLGIVSFLIAVVVKFGLSLAIPETAVTSGVLSALTELGAAALFLRPRMRGADVVAFGAGIGCFEILLKTALGVVGASEAAGSAVAVPLLLPLVEHAANLVGHTATRVMVYVGRSVRRLLPAVFALLTFSLVDGVADYGHLRGWDWGSLAVYGPFVLFVTVTATVEAGAALYFWRSSLSSR
jgi:hypothetical protein